MAERDRKSKKSVDYSLGGDVCGSCEHFKIDDGACDRVEGMIDPWCWCKLFKRIEDQECSTEDDGVDVYVIARYGGERE